MDSFSIIQNFFTTMQCHFCQASFRPEGIELIREQQGFYLVDVHCAKCGQHNGVAMVGVETGNGEAESYGMYQEEMMDGLAPDMASAIDDSISQIFAQQGNMPQGLGRTRHPGYRDPEFTEMDEIRLSDFDTITDNDVLEAHEFIEKLDADWMKFIPPEVRAQYTGTDTQ